MAVSASEIPNVCELMLATSSAFRSRTFIAFDIAGLAATAEDGYLVADDGVEGMVTSDPRSPTWTRRPRGRTRSMAMRTAGSAGAVTTTTSNPDPPATAFSALGGVRVVAVERVCRADIGGDREVLVVRRQPHDDERVGRRPPSRRRWTPVPARPGRRWRRSRPGRPGPSD